MKNLTLKAIAEVTEGRLVLPNNSNINLCREVAGVINDNRLIEKDYLFVPMVGAKVDGHDLIGNAFERGALATLSERELSSCPGPYILVDDTKLALKKIAAFYREQLSIPVIGVIGSVGKTSTKEMLTSVLSTKYNVLKTEGNLNNEIGLPLTLCRIRDEHEVAVVEMGIGDFGEMHRLGEMAKPNFVVMTNIGQCHLEFLIDRDGVLRAKTEVFSHMPKDALVVLNGDDDKLATCDTLGLSKVFFGLGEEEYHATDIEPEGLDATKAVFHISGDTFSATIPLPGVHNVLNGLAACAVGKALGLSTEEMISGLEHATTISGRNNVLHHNEMTIIDDCYNANPGSMRASIEVLSRAKGRSIAVLGDMGELGTNERELHAGLAEVLVTQKIDLVFTAGTLAEEIDHRLSTFENAPEHYHFTTVDEMIPKLTETVATGDSILVKASHFMNFAKVVKALTE